MESAVTRYLRFFCPVIKSFRKYIVTVLMAGKYALTSAVRNVKTSFSVNDNMYLPRLLRNFAANVAVVTCVATYCIGIWAPSIFKIQIQIIKTRPLITLSI